MRSIVLCLLALLAFVIPAELEAVASDWLSAPKPNFPPRALRKGSEGSVRLKLLFAQDGSVTNAKILKTSGDSVLDETARSAVLKWKMKPSAIKPSDLTKGRVEEIEFRQEAMMSATYPLSVSAGFSGQDQWKRWIHAPFPYYPMDARRLRHTGTVLLIATIGKDGQVFSVQLFKTSGYSDLDEEASKAVRHWKAHKEYAGQRLGVPVRFQLTPH
jgi:TonB family protein